MAIRMTEEELQQLHLAPGQARYIDDDGQVTAAVTPPPPASPPPTFPAATPAPAPVFLPPVEQIVPQFDQFGRRLTAPARRRQLTKLARSWTYICLMFVSGVVSLLFPTFPGILLVVLLVISALIMRNAHQRAQ